MLFLCIVFLSQIKNHLRIFLINLQAPHSNLNFLKPVNQQQWWWGQLGGRSCCARKVAPLKFPSFSFSSFSHSHLRIIFSSLSHQNSRSFPQHSPQSCDTSDHPFFHQSLHVMLGLDWSSSSATEIILTQVFGNSSRSHSRLAAGTPTLNISLSLTIANSSK